MCGIVGLFDPYLNKKNIIEKIKIANQSQFHRGPDDSGIFNSENTNFSHAMTRLSIIGIDEGKQPFLSEDGRYSLVFNGEIINYPELKKHLISKGIKLKTQNSDTEVLLKLLILYKENALEKLNGMFAFSFYDKKTKKILIARDRFGIKPLYFFNNNSFGFASELNTLLKIYQGSININKQAVSDYLSLMYIMSPETIYENIYKLKHGHFIIYDISDKKIIIRQWHKHKFCKNEDITYESAKKEIRDKAIESIKRWSISDVPISNSLSGGLDSSSISSILGYNNIDVKNFTVGFENLDSSFDETKLAKLVASKYLQKHECINLKEEYLLNNFDNIINDTHEPYGGGLPSWFVYEEMSKAYKVGFVGTGVDEFFGNYGNWYNLEKLFSTNENTSFENFNKKYFETRCYGNINEKAKIVNFKLPTTEPTENKLYEIFKSAEGDIRDKSAILSLETQLPDEFLSICDLFSMSHSLEIRPPYLDNDFTGYLFTIPSNIRTSSNKSKLKKLFKESVKEFLPQELLNKKKRGFILPTERWLKGKLNKMLKYYLSKDKIKESGLIKPDIYEKFIIPFLNRNIFASKLDRYHRYQTQIWSLLMFQLWFEKHINKKDIRVNF